jgi:hypothetical protein
MNTKLRNALVTAFALSSVCTAVYASIAESSTIRYYSDSTRTTLVGIEMYTCSGLHDLDGQRTPYSTEVRQSCSANPGGGGGPGMCQWPDLDPFCGL